MTTCHKDVGREFVRQYYQLLKQSPELVFHFYKDESSLSRPGSDDKVIEIITTSKSIKDYILSCNFKDHGIEIESADTLPSYMDCVVVMVCGILTAKDGVRRRFTQCFFLAHQENGYFCLNDLFRYVDEPQSVESPAENTVDEKESNVLTSSPESVDASENEVVVVTDDVEKSTNETVAAVETTRLASPQQDGSQNVAPVDVQEDIPAISPCREGKISYASILRTSWRKDAPPVIPHRVSVSASAVCPPPAPRKADVDQRPSGSSVSDHAVRKDGNSRPQSSNGRRKDHLDAKPRSIFVQNLPYKATEELVEECFKQFGAIRHNGVRVICKSENNGPCFGFIDFESPDSASDAIEKEIVTIQGREVYIQPKRPGYNRRPRNGNNRSNGDFNGAGNNGGHEQEWAEHAVEQPRGSRRNGEMHHQQQYQQNGNGKAVPSENWHQNRSSKGGHADEKRQGAK